MNDDILVHRICLSAVIMYVIGTAEVVATLLMFKARVYIKGLAVHG